MINKIDDDFIKNLDGLDYDVAFQIIVDRLNQLVEEINATIKEIK